jgi:hypothetical protein
MVEKIGLEILSKKFSEIPKGMSHRVNMAIVKVREDSRAALMTESPVGKTGNFRSSWEAASDVAHGKKFIAVASIWNPLIYADPLETGSRKGARPWPSAGPRTVENKGRVWSSQAVGGVINQVLTESYLKDLSQSIEKAAFGGLA